MIVLRSIGGRLAASIPLLLLVTLCTFLLLYAVGDPAAAIAGNAATDEQIAIVRRTLGLDRSVLEQYVDWLSGVFTGDFGNSFRTERDVGELIGQRVGATVSVAGLSMVFALIVSIPLATLGARHPHTFIDRTTRSVSVLGLSIPNFFLGLVLVLIFAVQLGWLPATGYTRLGEDPVGWLRNLVLPAVTLGSSLAGEQARTLRASLATELSADYVRTARAKNVPEWIVVGRHAARNSMLPLITVIGLQSGRLLAGTVLIETVFAVPGLGRLATEAVFTRDLPIVQAIVLLTGVIVLLANLAVDLSYLAFSPATRSAK